MEKIVLEKNVSDNSGYRNKAGKNKYSSAKELKRRARVLLSGNFMPLVLATLIIYAISMSVSGTINGAVRFNMNVFGGGQLLTPQAIGSLLFASVLRLALSVLMYFVMYFLDTGIVYMAYKTAKGERPRIEDVFFAFKRSPATLFTISLLMFALLVVSFIPYVIFAIAAVVIAIYKNVILLPVIMIITGIIITLTIYYVLIFRYMLVLYIYIEEPELGAMNILKKSAVLMKGNKMRAFRLMLSFLGISFLALLTCGIALLWVKPYMMVTYINFYLEIAHPRGQKIDWRPYVSYAG